MLQCPECHSRGTVRDYPEWRHAYCWDCLTRRERKVLVVRVDPPKPVVRSDKKGA